MARGQKVEAAFAWMRGLGLVTVSEVNCMSWLTPTLQDLLLEAFWETLIMVGAAAAVAIASACPSRCCCMSPTVTGWPRSPGSTADRADRERRALHALHHPDGGDHPLHAAGRGHLHRHHAAIVPLALAATAFLARLFENALREVDKGVVEAARAMGATRLQIVCQGAGAGGAARASSPPSPWRWSRLVGFSAMAGAVGGGGLGDLGIRFGYQRFMPEVMATVVILLIVFVQGLQSLGDWLVRRVRRR
jgi:D-methionine transport system permease protein